MPLRTQSVRRLSTEAAPEGDKDDSHTADEFESDEEDWSDDDDELSDEEEEQLYTQEQIDTAIDDAVAAAGPNFGGTGEDAIQAKFAAVMHCAQELEHRPPSYVLSSIVDADSLRAYFHSVLPTEPAPPAPPLPANLHLDPRDTDLAARVS